MWAIEHLFCQLADPLPPLFHLAYVGPGLGAAAVGIVIGLLTSIFLAIFTIFWYPIKRCIAFFRSKSKKDKKPDDPQ